MNLFSGLVDELEGKARDLANEVSKLPLPEQIETLNRVRSILHNVSPFKDEPVDLVIWVVADEVENNDYNPNSVAPPELRLLKLSVERNGFTQPIVTYPRDDGTREVVDGEHRSKVGRAGRISKRLHGYLPVTSIKDSEGARGRRMEATIQHNRARGVHGVLPMTDIVAALLQYGWTDDEIGKALGMGADELLRFKQNKGLPELFRDREYSKAWE